MLNSYLASAWRTTTALLAASLDDLHGSDWFKSSTPDGPSARWLAGHALLVLCRVCAEVAPTEPATIPDGWKEQFLKLSADTHSPKGGPEPLLLAASIRRVSEMLVSLLSAADSDVLARSTNNLSPGSHDDIVDALASPLFEYRSSAEFIFGMSLYVAQLVGELRTIRQSLGLPDGDLCLFLEHSSPTTPN